MKVRVMHKNLKKINRKYKAKRKKRNMNWNFGLDGTRENIYIAKKQTRAEQT